MKRLFLIPLVFISFALVPTARAAVKPNPLFSDGAVLQRGIAAPVWGTAGEGERVTVKFDGQKVDAVASGGKWMVHLKPHTAGGPYTLTLASAENTVVVKNVMVGEVWICSGQSNMEFWFSDAANAATEAPLANYPNLRMFRVGKAVSITPKAEVTGSWDVCSPKAVLNCWSAVGYFFGRDIHNATGVPVGMIHAAWGGTPAQAWTSLAGLEKDKELEGYVTTFRKLVADYPQASLRYTREMPAYQIAIKRWKEEVGKDFLPKFEHWIDEMHKAQAEGKPVPPQPQPARPKPIAPPVPDGGALAPTGIYNAMIAPMIPYGIRGVIWYQGESNAPKPREYRTLFPRLIADWREQWRMSNLPFLFVQIAPYVDQPPELREAQLLTWQKTPATAMAVTTDVGEALDIHPKRKEPVGVRLALAARALVYGEKLVYSGPVYDSMEIDQGTVTLHFQHVGSGLMAKGGEPRGFTIAGADKHFVPAIAQIHHNTVTVSSAQVPAPVAVRYGWANVPDVNLFNLEGLPASPFRTDVD